MSQFLVVAVAGWINQQERDVIDSFQNENRALRERLSPCWRSAGRLAALSEPLEPGWAFVRFGVVAYLDDL